MSTVSQKFPPTTIDKMQDYYQAYLVQPVQYSQFRAKVNQITITAYTSGKVVFQGHGAEEEAQPWLSQALEAPKSKQSQVSNSDLPDNLSQLNLIGSDEVGNGSYFGPLTICAVYLNQEIVPLAQELGARDSKQLTDAAISKIAPDLMVSLPYHLTIINPVKYNQLTKNYNANAIKAKTHHYTIHQLLTKLDKQSAPLDGILIDQFADKKTFYSYLNPKDPRFDGPVYFAQKAESLHLAVASASIIARYAFLQGLEKLGQAYQTVLPSGAGPDVDRFAARLIDRFGRESLNQTAKLHFANTQKALKISKN